MKVSLTRVPAMALLLAGLVCGNGAGWFEHCGLLPQGATDPCCDGETDREQDHPTKGLHLSACCQPAPCLAVAGVDGVILTPRSIAIRPIALVNATRDLDLLPLRPPIA